MIEKCKVNTLLFLLFSILSCVSVRDKGLGIVKGKFFFINQIQDTILFHEARCFGKDIEHDIFVKILPNDTLILQYTTEGFDDINNFPLSNSWCKIVYGRSGKCDYMCSSRSQYEGSFSLISSYEIRKVVSPRNFEFTYYITEAKKVKALDCRPNFCTGG